MTDKGYLKGQAKLNSLLGYWAICECHFADDTVTLNRRNFYTFENQYTDNFTVIERK